MGVCGAGQACQCECRLGFRGQNCSIDCPGGLRSYLNGFPVIFRVCGGHGECDREVAMSS
jgi:hypothetical protein